MMMVMISVMLDSGTRASAQRATNNRAFSAPGEPADDCTAYATHQCTCCFAMVMVIMMMIISEAARSYGQKKKCHSQEQPKSVFIHYSTHQFGPPFRLIS
jgi:hypothetical protein